MSMAPIAQGTALRHEWAPLEKAVEDAAPQGRIRPSDFMLMGVWREDGAGERPIYLYKHGETRRYLNLSLEPDGSVTYWRYWRTAAGTDGYAKQSREEAIYHATT